MNRFQPYSTNRGNKRGGGSFDKNCQECGVLIKGAAHQKPVSCFKCNAPQEGRNGWMEDGWGRCVDCDGWLNRNHSYCQCGFANPEAIQRKKQQVEAARQKEKFRQEQEILRKEQESSDLRRMLGEATRTNMALQRRIDDREAEDRQQQNNEIFVEQMQGVNLDNED